MDHQGLIKLKEEADRKLQEEINKTNPVVLLILKIIYPKLRGYNRKEIATVLSQEGKKRKDLLE